VSLPSGVLDPKADVDKSLRKRNHGGNSVYISTDFIGLPVRAVHVMVRDKCLPAQDCRFLDVEGIFWTLLVHLLVVNM
jgi:hypothetical protein